MSAAPSLCGLSQPNPLHLVLRQPLLYAVVDLGGARALVGSHRVFKRAAVGKIRRDAGRPQGVVADRRMDSGDRRTPADLRHRLLGEHGRRVPTRA
jgi:hypothetical protein